jgi:signal transduction histidine kinase
MTMTGRPAQQSDRRLSGRRAGEQPAFSRDALILAQQLATCYKTFSGGIVGGAGAAVLLAFGLYRGAPPKGALVWLAVFFAATLFAWCICYWYKRSLSDPGKNRVWSMRFMGAVFVVGLAWGGAGIALFEDNEGDQFLLAFALLLVSLSGVTGGSVYLPSVVAFNTPVLVPIIVRMGLVGDHYHLLIAAGIFLVHGLMLYFASQINRLITRSIEMRFENKELNEALTEQRVKERTRALEIANQHKSEFLANMSHELRTPLNAVIGFSEVLKDGTFGEMSDKQTEYVQDIHASGHHLLSLINDVLDLSKVEAGQMELSVSTFDFPSAINNALMLVHERAARRQLSVDAQIVGQLGSFNGDERKLKQILLNLLSNAIKFTPEGGTIVVHATPTLEGVQVSVTDSGIGIAPEHHEEVFLAFHQVGDTAKKQQGTGLGLALVKQFVELHGGQVGVESALNRGSTFTFTLAEQHGERTNIDH